MIRFRLGILCVILMCQQEFISAQTLPTGFSSVNIASGWTEPLGVAFSKDGQKMFVWEKAGKVFICNWNTTTQTYDKQANPVIDISPEVGNWRDFGLVGFAIDPSFDTNGLIYLFYVVDRHYLLNFGTAAYSNTKNDYFSATIGRITRYKTIVNGSNQRVADLNSRFILLGATPSDGNAVFYESHGVGSIGFAADGTLLASTGDGASYSRDDPGSDPNTYYADGLADGIITPQQNVGAFRSQMLSSLNGKILRIDPVTGNGILSNPFYDAAHPKSVKSRVWALGFRNPFRFTIKPNSGSTNPATGDIGEIYVGDVGSGSFEEMDIVTKGGMNFGWPLFEGQTATTYFNFNTQNADEPNPLFGTGGCTQQFLPFKNLIKQATADGNTTVYNPCDGTKAIGTNTRFFHERPAIDWQHGVASSRIGTFNGNNAATAQLGSAASGVQGTPFQGNCSVAGTWYTGTLFPPAYRNTYLFADYGVNWVQRATMKNSFQLQQIDPFISGLKGIVNVTQNPLDGSIVCVEIASANPVKKINYGGNQPPVTVMTSDKIFGPSVLAVNFTGSNSHDPENAAITYAWDFGDGNTSTASNPSHNFTSTGGVPKKFVVKLTVKDNMNLTSIDSIIISVNNTPPVVNIISPVKNSKYVIGQDTLYSLQATVSDAEQPDGKLTYQWQTILRHNNHQHPEAIDTNRITSSQISRIGCNGDTYYWMINLIVTDAAGLSAMDSAKIFPLCPGDIILPVTLVSFNVSKDNGVNLVKWITDKEVNCKEFIVERSSDGQSFESISKQPARNQAGEQTYFYADDRYTGTISYYRLRMTDVDGSVTYSKTVKLVNGNETDFAIHILPNPVKKELTLSTAFPVAGAVQINISGADGKLVKVVRENVSKGFSTIQLYQLEKLKPGTYFIELIQNDYHRTAKFVKVE